MEGKQLLEGRQIEADIRTWYWINGHFPYWVWQSFEHASTSVAGNTVYRMGTIAIELHHFKMIHVNIARSKRNQGR
jgi:hypothetical protein